MKAIACTKYGSPEVLQLVELIDSGKVQAVIDNLYPLDQIVEAHRYVDKGHKRGSVVITIPSSEEK